MFADVAMPLPKSPITVHQVAVIPGDLAGAEVVDQGSRVLQALIDLGEIDIRMTWFPWGAGHYLRTGRAAPTDIVDTLRGYDAVYFGAHGRPGEVPDHIGGQQLVAAMRKGLGLSVNLRPSRTWPGVESPLRHVTELDFVIVRENTEGEYTHAGGIVHDGTPDAVATQIMLTSRRATERVMRYAFELAGQRRDSGRPGHVLSVTKSNALSHTMGLWDKVFQDVAAENPGIVTGRILADAMAARLITNPGDLDVVVATNLMGDILSDEAAAIVGSLGLAPSGNLDPSRQSPSMFEPCHGSAPDIAGTGRANPVGAILAAAMMLDWLGEHRAASLVEAAVARVLAAPETRTPDVGGTARTDEMTDALIDALTDATAGPPGEPTGSGPTGIGPTEIEDADGLRQTG